MGMKGVPHLARLLEFNPATGVVIDEMHAIFLGVVKRMMYQWFYGTFVKKTAKGSATKRINHLACKLTEEKVLFLLRAISYPNKSLINNTFIFHFTESCFAEKVKHN